MLAAGAGVALPGCYTAGTRPSARGLPEPVWPDLAAPEPPALADASAGAARGAPLGRLVLGRGQWAADSPQPSLMKPMRPIRYVTVHHSAGPVFTAADRAGTVERLEGIRRYHRSRSWGDIGYHFAVDRAGRVWECRSLRYQGAHVKDHNEGNVGVVALGNFDQQRPTGAQLEGLTRIVRELMARYRVPAARLRTHQEWAPTACPGRALQPTIVSARSNGRFG